MTTRLWGAATMDDGIFAVGGSRRWCLAQSGFATPIRRAGGQGITRQCYLYSAVEPDQERSRSVYIGPLMDLFLNHFETSEDTEYESD